MAEKDLQRYRTVRGTDFYRADPEFAALLKRLVPAGEWAEMDRRLAAFSEKVSTRWDELAEETALHYQGPRIDHYDPRGNRIDKIWLPPPARQMRREVVEAGVFDNRSQVEQFAKVYLLGHLGEASVTCPLACTEGLIRAIEAAGSDYLKKEWLPRIRSAETPLAGAQFITEMDMGSDVGALTTEAKPEGEGRWRLTGEKWFCSAIDEYFLVAARPDRAPKGTDGVAIFFVPRTWEGRLNNLQIKRLKDKIGTRELPTAEIELSGALGFNIGPVENGFKSLMTYVLNTSRVMNAGAACGTMARSWLEAKNYATQRGAFGTKIIDYPLVQASLAKIYSLLSVRRAVYFEMVARLDSGDPLWNRFLINLCKYRTAVAATEAAHEAISILAGNGTIETFSILPRLYRDSLVIETWEGTHNVLALQICRDGLRFPFREAMGRAVDEGAERLKKKGRAEEAARLARRWDQTAPDFDRLKDAAWVSREARAFVDRLGELLELAT